MNPNRDAQGGRALLLAPLGRDASLMQQVLAAAGLPADCAADMEALCAEIDEGAGVAVLTDETLTADGVDRLLVALGHQPRWSDLPLVVCSRGGALDATRGGPLGSLVARGSVTLVERPVRTRILVSAVRAALNARRRQYELRDVIEQRERALREAEEASRLKDEFLATVSHELRTPLTAMLGWAQMLRAGSVAPSRRAHALETIERNARAQAQLVEDLLDVSRIVSGNLRLEFGPVLLSRCIEQAVETVRMAADAKGLHLELDLDPQVGAVVGDAARLQQVAWNLLTNAVKFTPRGGVVRVEMRRDGPQVEATFSDTGQGVPAGFLPYLFDRFRQADGSSTRTKGGLGLGLSIVRHLVELHGGTITAASDGEGRGATFVVRLPLAGSALPEEHRPSQEPPRLAFDCPPEVIGRRVLVVEDEPDTRELLVMILEMCGVVVTAAGSAAEALEMIRRERPDLLVSDIGMPGGDGYSLIGRVRALPDDRAARVPAVALTAYARAEDRARALTAGFDDHVAKPVEPQSLLRAVAARLR